MSRVVRAAVTETINHFGPMPKSADELESLAGRLDEVRAANVEHHVELLSHAAKHGVQVVGLGELFAGPYFALEQREFWRGLAEDWRTGPTVKRMREIAHALKLVIVAPIYELDADSGQRFNTAVLIESDGTLLGRYRKAHIPAGTNEQASFCETFYYDPSDGAPNATTSANVATNPFFPVFETSVGRIGVAICYDRHFEGVMASLAAGGAELVFNPAVTFGAQSQRLWTQESAVDAARHNLIIAASNRRGAELPWSVEYFGESHFVGPTGRLPTIDVHPSLIIADIDLGALEAGDGSGWDRARDARPEAY